jgi:SAM-dependent methyltransferase
MPDKRHWEKIYSTKTKDQLSWTQAIPRASLYFISTLHLPTDARILDVGGGDSHLASFLLDQGYEDITVLDISEEALRRAQQQLGDKAGRIKWIVADITEFQPYTPYDFWHDRATFHFLTTPPQVRQYLSAARQAVRTGGYAVIGTFSEQGPEKCSGLPVRQYTEQELIQELHHGFKKIECITEDHRTPFNTLQHFLFCSFRRN